MRASPRPVSTWIARPRRSHSLANTLLWRVITESAHFIMERKMLKGIRRRAEAP